MKSGTITYFEKSGKQNTKNLLEAVKNRIKQKDIKYIVVATSTGKTALLISEIISVKTVKIVAVTLHTGFNGRDTVTMRSETEKKLIEKGIVVFRGSHALSGVGRSITNKFGGITPVEIIASTLRTFCGHGLKVAVEISVMAADAGLIPTNQNIIAIGGTHAGADTAVVLKPAHMNNFFDLEISEIIAKPLKS